MALRPSLMRLAHASKTESRLTVHNNPYKAQKSWPPDFSNLPQTYQFNLERRYRRRSKLRYSNPSWEKNVKLTSYVLCGAVLVYGVLFMDWKSEFGQEDKPFESVRDFFWSSVNSVWTTNSTPKRNIPNTVNTDAHPD